MGRVFRRCLGRYATEAELHRAEEYHELQAHSFRDDPEAAGKLSPPGPLPGISLAEGAAWTSVARILMNLDEFITRE